LLLFLIFIPQALPEELEGSWLLRGPVRETLTEVEQTVCIPWDMEGHGTRKLPKWEAG
jgi:hypothetical protein